VSLEHRPDVRFGAIASFSLLPRDGRLGLPVQDGDKNLLCEKVESGLVDLPFRPFENLPGVGRIRGWIEDPMERFVSNFCSGSALIDPEQAREIEQQEEDDQVEDRCNWEEDVSEALDSPTGFARATLEGARRQHAEGKADLRTLQCYGTQQSALLANLPAFGAYEHREPPAEALAVPAGASGGCSFNRTTCEENARSDIQRRREEAEQSPDGEGGAAGSNEMDGQAREKTTPKVIYSAAKNGDRHFQVWSIVSADDARVAATARGVELAAHGRQRVRDASFLSRLGWAQAEFYYDHEGPWSDAAPESMWNLKWRARLRRVRPPTVNLLENAAGQLLPKIQSRLAGFIDGGDSPNSVLDVLLKMEFNARFDELEREITEAAVSGDDAVERRARRIWRSVGGVH
jgi:hypothetical protein